MPLLNEMETTRSLTIPGSEPSERMGSVGAGTDPPFWAPRAWLCWWPRQAGLFGVWVITVLHLVRQVHCIQHRARKRMASRAPGMGSPQGLCPVVEELCAGPVQAITARRTGSFVSDQPPRVWVSSGGRRLGVGVVQADLCPM